MGCHAFVFPYLNIDYPEVYNFLAECVRRTIAYIRINEYFRD
jgi:hypothetical protein